MYSPDGPGTGGSGVSCGEPYPSGPPDVREEKCYVLIVNGKFGALERRVQMKTYFTSIPN